MSIAFSCHECNRRYEVADKAAGRSTTCAKCGAELIVPEKAVKNPAVEASLQRQQNREVLGIDAPETPDIAATLERIESHLAARRRWPWGAGVTLAVGLTIFGMTHAAAVTEIDWGGVLAMHDIRGYSLQMGFGAALISGGLWRMIVR